MKKIIIGLVAMISTLSSMSQSAQTSIAGKVIDNRNTPVESATISLMNAKDSSVVKLAVSDKEGKYYFEGITYGDYFVTVSSVNFNSENSATFNISANISNKILEPVALQPRAKELTAVVISAKKPLIDQKIDRMVVNVDASVTNVGSTALEVLEKSPGITVDKDGNIILKGKSSVMVMIDGKPSYLSSADLANLLGNMNANQLSQIEIMTNPSAKYDAAGNAGVINIKTKKNATKGFNGSVTLSYGQGKYAKSNNSIMLNYSTGKFNAFINYGYSLNNSFFNINTQRNFLGADGKLATQLDQQATRTNKSQNINLKLGLDYFISKQSTLGFVASGFLSPQKQDGVTNSTLRDDNSDITSIQKTIRTVDNSWKNGALNLNFHTSADNGNKDLTTNLDYLHYDFSGNQLLDGFSFSPNGIFLSKNNIKNTLPLTIDIYSARVDYTSQLGNYIKLETGLKSSVVKTNNTSDFFSLMNNQWVTDSVNSNAFNYSENINAGYVNLNKTFEKWTAQAGLRLENTNYKGVQTALSQQPDSSFNRSYFSLFPSAFISYEANEINRYALSVSRRIDRPEYRDLNPFISYLDQYTYSTGNPFLQPQFSYNVELSHSYKNMFTTTLNYSVIHNMINETFSQFDTLIVRSVGNIGTRYNIGIAESASIPFTPWYTGIFYANLYQNSYNGLINGSPFKATQLTFAINVNNQFSFKKGWAAELSGTFTSRNRDEGQAIVLPYGQVAAGLSKSLLNNKASLKFNVRDIFYTQNPKEIQNFQDVQSTIRITRDTRVFTLAFVYRFGISNKSKSSASPTEEQKRVQLN